MRATQPRTSIVNRFSVSPKQLIALVSLGATLIGAPALSAAAETTIAPVEYTGPKLAPARGGFGTAATTDFPQTGGFSVDISNRQHAQAFFNAIYMASENTPLNFSGSVASCSPGTTNSLFKDAVALRINWFREMAGVTDDITFRQSFSNSAQDAALIMAANGLLTHTPNSSLTCYTSTGDDGAGSSNLALGTLGWDSIAGYMEDAGSNNAAVGHRRWLLHPPIQQMGTGDIPATSTSPATNAIWVFDDNISGDGPMRDGFVAWPPPGYVPYNVVPPRWSFSFKNANFNNASVSMTRNGAPISTVEEPLAANIGLDTLVWIPLGLDADNGELWPRPDGDETLTVQISNVLINGSPQSFNYTVNVFDSTYSDQSDEVATITGPDTVSQNASASFELAQISFAQSYNLRSSTLNTLTAIEGAEGSAEFVSDGTDADYPLFSTDAAANGSASLHLAHANAQDQHVVWERQILPSETSELRFASRLGFASVTQIAKAQVTLDDGQSWRDVYSQPGSDGRGETSFTNRAVSLSEFAGSVIKIRFFYDVIGGSYYPQTSSGVGFYIDDIQVTNAQELENITVTPLGNADSFSFTATRTGEHVLQAQYLGWNGFAGSAWGPIKTLQSTQANSTAIAASVLPASRSVFDSTATAFATVINGGTEMATECQISPQTASATTFSYQTTNPANNALTGTANTPVNIAPGAFQTFALFLEPTQAFDPTEIVLTFDCANSAPAPVVNGLNTLLLASGSVPVPDVIALAATGASGIVDIPGNTGTGVFAVATVNAGASGTITASATGPSGVSVQVCETNPTTGACVSAVGSSVTTSIAGGATPTFGFFVTGSENIPFDPAGNRVSVVFSDGGGVTRGATSVAIRTN